MHILFDIIHDIDILLYYDTWIDFIIAESAVDFSSQVGSQEIPNTETMCKGGWIEMTLIHRPLSETDGVTYDEWLPRLTSVFGEPFKKRHRK